jgi:lysophospholipase L1-like esterase
LVRSVLAVLLVGATSLSAFAQEPVRVACIGDSVTKAQGAKSWPRQLGKMLGEGYRVGNFSANAVVCLKTARRTVWRGGEIKAAARFRPDIVIIMLGTNMGKPGHWKQKARYAGDYCAVIAFFAKLPTKPKIYLCRPIPVAKDNYGIVGKTVKDEVTPVIETIAKEDKLPLIDTYTPLAGKPELLPDGVHPSAVGCEVIAKAVCAAIRLPVPSRPVSGRPLSIEGVADHQ